MKLERFFEKFDLFAEAPDAVARMREVVLELAVRGKLTEQKTEDTKDPEWQKLTALLDADTHQSSAVFQQPFVIPTSWKWATLEKLGNSKPRNDIAETTKCSFVPMKHIPSEYGFLVQHEERIWGEIKKGYTHFKNDDVVLAKITPCFENGKSAVMKGLMGGYGAGTTELHVFRPGSKAILPEFVLVYLKTRGFISRGEPQMTGSAGQKRVPQAYFARSPFPLPPLAEQKRIVAKVDELMALCDQLEEQQQERQTRHAALVQAGLARFTQDPTPANLQLLFHPSYTVSPADLRKTILTLAVQGKLVPQESDSVLGTLQSILSEASVNGVSKGPTADTSAVEVLRISAGTSREDFYVNEADFKHVDLPPNDVEKFRLVPGDLLACRFNGNLHFVGRFSLYRGESGRIQVNPDKLIRFRINTALHSPRYVCFAMNAAPTREAIEAMCATTAGNIGLSAGKLKTVEIPLPPLAEQRRIVAKVDELLALVDELENQLVASRTVAQNLLAALVRELTTTP